MGTEEILLLVTGVLGITFIASLDVGMGMKGIAMVLVGVLIGMSLVTWGVLKVNKGHRLELSIEDNEQGDLATPISLKYFSLENEG